MRTLQVEIDITGYAKTRGNTVMPHDKPDLTPFLVTMSPGEYFTKSKKTATEQYITAARKQDFGLGD